MMIEPIIYPVFINFPYEPGLMGDAFANSEYSLKLNFLEPIDYPFDSLVCTDTNGNIFLIIDNNDLVMIDSCYSFSLVIGNKKYNINNQKYPAVEKYLDLNSLNEKGEFTFTGSENVANKDIVLTEELGPRCDNLMNGPMVFLRPGEVPIGPDFNSTIIGSLSDLSLYHPIISVDGVGHIIYVELVEDHKERFDINQNNMPKATRSIGELLKLMIEWQNVSLDPWNSTENIAIACRDFFGALNVPQQVLDDVESGQCDFQVYKYLKGDLNARQRPAINDIRDLTEFARKWLNSHFFYYSMEQLTEKIR